MSTSTSPPRPRSLIQTTIPSPPSSPPPAGGFRRGTGIHSPQRDPSQDEPVHEEQGRHTLAVQAVALDLSTPLHYRGGGENGSGGDAPGGILYSGGRDGLLMSVDLGLPTRRRRFKYGRTWDDGRDSDSDDSEPEYDFDRTPQAGFRDDQLDYWGVGARASTSSKRKSGGRPRKSSSASTSASVRRSGADGPLSAEELWEVDDDRVGTSVPRDTFRQSVQAHTDWINDIVLCNNNQTLVSASSDASIRAFNPHSPHEAERETTTLIGQHTDYVRCLVAPRTTTWVGSGGFDRTIKLWDLAEGRSKALMEMPTQASVYSMTATPSGSLIAVGSPERVIRIWDPKSRRQVARLGGHTDNVRAVLLSEEGKWLLSASSDSTVKLWSLAAQRCLATWTHHESSVWALFSQHPSLEVFYSGDKSGLLYKTVSGGGEPADGETVLLGGDQPRQEGDGCSGITQIVAQDDSWVWTTGGSTTVQRWKDVPSKRLGRATSLRSAAFSIREDNESTESLLEKLSIAEES